MSEGIMSKENPAYYDFAQSHLDSPEEVLEALRVDIHKVETALLLCDLTDEEILKFVRRWRRLRGLHDSLMLAVGVEETSSQPDSGAEKLPP